MKSALLMEIDRAHVAVLTLRGELRLARRQTQDRSDHLAAAMAQTDTVKKQLDTLSALAALMKE